MSDQPLEQNQNLSNTQVPAAPPSGGDPQGSAPASEVTSATPAPSEGETPEAKQSRRESRAYANMRRENRELQRALGRMEARLEAIGQPAPPQTEAGTPPATRQGPTPEQIGAYEAHEEASQIVIERLEDALDAVDGGDVVMRTITHPSFPISTVMRDFLGETEHPAQMAKLLADDPDEARRISRLTPVMALRALERHEAKLAAPPASKKTTQAPPPVPTVGGRSTAPFDPEKASMEEYAAHWRQRNGIKG